MNRRDFLRIASPLAAAGLILPELLLPKRTFFLPPTAGWCPDIQQWINEDMRQAFLAAERNMWGRGSLTGMAEALELMQADLLAFGTGAININRAFEDFARVSHVPIELLRVTRRAGLPKEFLNNLETKRRLA